MLRNRLIESALKHIKSPLYRNAFFLMANTAVTGGLGFFFWMIVARLYTEEEVGWGAAIISAMSFLALLGGVGLGFALIRLLPKAEKPIEMINSCFTLSGIITLALAAVFIAGINLWSPALWFIRENIIFSLAFAFFATLWALSGVMDFAFIAMRRADFVLSKNTLFALLKIPLPIVLVLFFHAFGIVASWGIAIGVALAVSVFLFLPRVHKHYKPVPRLDLSVISNIWRYSAGNYLANLLAQAPILVLPIMIVNLLGAEQNAYFYVTWRIAGLLFAIPGAVSQSLFAEGSHSEGELAANVRRSLRFVFILLVPAVVLLFLLGKWLLLLFGEAYSLSGLTLLWILAISSLLIGINSVYRSILMVEGRIRELVIINGLRAAAVLLGTYLIVPTTEIVGIGYAWIAPIGALSVYVLFRMRSFYLRRQL